MVRVTLARTATPTGSPVSAGSPEGTSTANTVVLESFTA